MTRRQRVPAAGLVKSEGFVNPYTFVPLPSAASARSEPTSHRTFTGRSGLIHVEIETLTPLLIGGDRVAATTGQPATVKPIRVGETYVIPPTTLKGLVRSMVEVMTGSCLRNFDLTRRFTRRALAEGEALNHAFVVHSVGDDCIELRFAAAYKLQIRNEHRTYVNDLPDLEDGQIVKVALLAHGMATLYQGGVEAILKLSDVRGADPAVKFRRNQYVVKEEGAVVQLQLADTVGRKGTGLNLVEAYNAAWADAIAAESPRKEGESDPKKVWCAEQLEGCSDEDRKKWGRRWTRHQLQAGDVVWADSADANRITILGASRIGRRAGQLASAAVPDEFHACSDLDNLCWSCRMFGMVAGKRQEDDRSAAFAGHVRFGWSTLLGSSPKLVPLQLPALSSPKPANGWYLLPGSAGENQRWDGPTNLLEIAGSKLYLHKRKVSPRHGEHPDQCADVNALDREVKFTAVLRYDNLSDAELGSLVAALDPRHLETVDKRFTRAALKVGMGKSVGLGSIRCSVAVDEVDRKARYSGLSDNHARRLNQHEIAALVAAFTKNLVENGVVGHWPALAAALDFDLVADKRVTYPPGKREPHEHFEWFGKNRGQALAQPEQIADGSRQKD